MKRPSARLIFKSLVATSPKRVALIAVTATLGQGLSALTPLLVGLTVDHGVIERKPEWVIGPLIAYALVSFVSSLSGFYEIRLTGKLAQEYMRTLRRDLLTQLFYMDLDFFTRESSGKVVSRLTVDVENVQQLAERGFSLIVRGIFGVSLTFLVMFFASIQLAIVVGLVVILVLPVTWWFMRKAFARQLDMREKIGALMGRVGESMSGIRVIQAYGLEESQKQEFDMVNRDVSKSRMNAAWVNARYFPTLEFFRLSSIALVIGVGALMATRGEATPGTVIAFTLYATRLFEPVLQLSEISFLLQTAAASFSKIFEFMAQRPSVVDLPGAPPFVPGTGGISMDGVSFSYGEGQPLALENINLQIQPGERVALVGASGAGKSTFAKLLSRFYDPTEGSVSIDGQDLKEVAAESLRKHLSLVPQEGFLFNGTIAANIAVTRPSVSPEEIAAVCDAVGITKSLSGLEAGLDTVVSSGGQTLSSGQRQLVSLARAFLGQPNIILLDEATSNIDSTTEALVQDALRRVLTGRTAVIIAHRVSTALSTDRVILLEHGRVVDDGPPGDLLRANGPFAKWATTSEAAAGF